MWQKKGCTQEFSKKHKRDIMKNKIKAIFKITAIILMLICTFSCVAISLHMYKMVNDRLPKDTEAFADSVMEKMILQQEAEYDALRSAALRVDSQKEKTETRTAYQIVNEYLISVSRAKKHDYNFNNIKEDGQFKYYVENGKRISKIGIDVSYYQGDIDWKKVKASGVDFVIIRLGFRGYGKEGKLVLDSLYEDNIKGAKEAGLDVGVYFFTQAITVQEAVEEAKFVIDNLKGYDLEYPVYIDTEAVSASDARTTLANLSQKELSNICIAFCDRIEEAGYRAGIYANKGWSLRQLDLEMLEDYEKWFAHYTDETDWPFAMKMWQYSCTGKVDGIKGDTDLNIYFE